LTVTLLAVPNVSEGRDRETIERIAEAFTDRAGAVLLDRHSDRDHHRSVFTIAGPPRVLSEAVLSGGRAAVAGIDVHDHAGAHPRVGAIDVAPIVYLRDEDLGAACAEALVLADRFAAELALPVFVYGALGGGRTRAQLRHGGPELLARRIARRELAPDFGPDELHPTAGAVLVGVRPPLVAFNVELAAPATLQDAKAVAAAIREGGPDGLPSVRAIGVWLAHRGVAQVSMNIEEHTVTALSRVVQAIARYAVPARAELVGLAPRAALEGFPVDVPLEGAATIEDALRTARNEGRGNL